jgi:hypothetical protein
MSGGGVTVRAVANSRFTLATVDRRCFYAPQPHGATGRVWPFAPATKTRPIRGGLNEPRSPVHFGVDVATHIDQVAVHALRSGRVTGLHPQRLYIGTFAHGFAYWHVVHLPGIHKGSRVRAGQIIGHILKGYWHVHISEFSRSKANYCAHAIDPRRPTGPFRDPANTEAPTIGPLSAYVAHDAAFVAPTITAPPPTPDPATPLALDALSGRVDFRASILDHPVHAMKPPPGPQLALAPSAIRAYLAPLSTRLRHIGHVYLWDGATVIPSASVSQTWAYGTYRQKGCYFQPARPCGIEIIWHLGGPQGFDTTRVPNGTYQYCVQALQIENHRSTLCTQVTIAN